MKSKICILNSNDQAALAMWLSKRACLTMERRPEPVVRHWGLAGWGLGLAAGAAFKAALWRVAGQNGRARRGNRRFGTLGRKGD